ncbi:hypothetical protein DXG01_014402 [Tephrocybe rancida]|nr:hypothetical protein DXG01_014402 [Tephrocybe rancida]
MDDQASRIMMVADVPLAAMRAWMRLLATKSNVVFRVSSAMIEEVEAKENLMQRESRAPRAAVERRPQRQKINTDAISYRHFRRYRVILTGHGKRLVKLWSCRITKEREQMMAFWLALGEEKRRTLVNIHKHTVLGKLREQQKHNCNCVLCVRKRAAIEEELEVIYDAYCEDYKCYASDPPIIHQGSFGWLDYHPSVPLPESVKHNSNCDVAWHNPRVEENEFYDSSDDSEEEQSEEGQEALKEQNKGKEKDNKEEVKQNELMPQRRRTTSSLVATGPGNTPTVQDDEQPFIDKMKQLAEGRTQSPKEAADDEEDDSDEGEDSDEGDDSDEDTRRRRGEGKERGLGHDDSNAGYEEVGAFLLHLSLRLIHTL